VDYRAEASPVRIGLHACRGSPVALDGCGQERLNLAPSPLDMPVNVQIDSKKIRVNALHFVGRFHCHPYAEVDHEFRQLRSIYENDLASNL
jgi:hypothetical protein